METPNPHYNQCKICMTLSTEDIEALEREALERKDNYTTIGAKYGIKYGSRITKQLVSRHMKWLREEKLKPEREALLKEYKDELLETLEEYAKVHRFIWDKIKELEKVKEEGGTPVQILRVYNAIDRFVKSMLKGIRILSDVRGDTERDIRKVDVSVIVKQLQKEVGMEDD